MKIVKLCTLLTLTASLLASSLAIADRGHGGGGHWRGNIGVYIGPGFGPYYSRPYYPRYYSYPFYSNLFENFVCQKVVLKFLLF